ncbi:MAG TPA: triose-phosphate isomerase [Candidatus Saccharimonadia bacterium]|nr:triose-phosphate isomerase [Candidatus Saccharimonadia bacterium]
MKKTLIVGNWKMNLDVHEASLLVKRLNDKIPVYREIEVVLAPSLLTLQPISQQIDKRKFKLAAQNAFYKDEGAFTGEVSFTMLREMVQYAIVGHSERRIYFGESLETVRDKVSAAIRNGISPILCAGETKQERAAGETKRVIHDQVTTALSNLTAEDVEKVVIAYEPVWAISTFGGELAKPDQIKEVVDQIRYQVSELYGADVSEGMRVIYGGSVDDQTATGYLGIDGVDGCLPGSASLNYTKFSGIVEKANALRHKEAKNG